MKTVMTIAMRWGAAVCLAVFLSVAGCTPESLSGPEVLVNSADNDGDGHNNADNDGDGHNNADNDGDGHNNKDNDGDGHNN